MSYGSWSSKYLSLMSCLVKGNFELILSEDLIVVSEQEFEPLEFSVVLHLM